MTLRNGRWIQSMTQHLNTIVAAAAVYAAFAVYLYLPHFDAFTRWQWLLPANACLACLGCFVLSRRWVGAYAGSLFAGAIYGFGPFMLNLARFHPAAGCLVASIPWLFLPAASLGKHRRRWVSIPLSALPFIAILLFFQISAQYRLFAVPIQARLQSEDLLGLIAPMVMADRTIVLIGFYHVPIAALTMGLAMVLAARRAGVLTVAALGVVLTFCNPLAHVSPIIWLALPTLLCSILIGAGMQGLASAGFADRKWVLLAAIATGIAAITMLLPATEYFQALLGLASPYAKIFSQTGKLYILATIAAAAIFLLARAKTRLLWLRWAVLCSATAVDIFLSARFIADKIH